MAASNVPIFPQSFTSTTIQFAPGDTTAEKDIFTAGAVGSKISAIYAYSTDTADRDIVLYFKPSGGTDLAFVTIKVPLTCGSVDTIPAINLLASAQFPLIKDAQGNSFFYLPASGKLRAAMGTTITTAKVINLWIDAADY
jgi:hypothetical protein